MHLNNNLDYLIFIFGKLILEIKIILSQEFFKKELKA
jgi:hypothetical protein